MNAFDLLDDKYRSYRTDSARSRDDGTVDTLACVKCATQLQLTALYPWNGVRIPVVRVDGPAVTMMGPSSSRRTL